MRPGQDATRLLGGHAGDGAAARAARSADPLLRWTAAVALGGRGYYAAAAALLEHLARDPAAGAGLRAHATVTRASHLRQLGGHADAAGRDARALRVALPAAAGVPADPADVWGLAPAAAVADALTGLAADALGRLDAGTAAVLLARAEPWCGPAGSRTRIRYDWVSAESALVRGDAAGALTAADAAVAGSRALGSARHLLKSRLVAAVAAAVAGRGARDELDSVIAGARADGAYPLYRAALLARADLVAGDPDARHRWSRNDDDAAVQATGSSASHADADVRHAGASQLDTRSRQTDAEGRRHALLHTVSVLYTRSDGRGRELLWDSRPKPAPDDVPYGLLHSAIHHPHVSGSGGTGRRTEGTNSPRPCQGERVTRRFGG